MRKSSHGQGGKRKGRLLLRPFPLSCFLHFAGLILLSLFLQDSAVQSEEQQKPEAEIVMEAEREPLPEPDAREAEQDSPAPEQQAPAAPAQKPQADAADKADKPAKAPDSPKTPDSKKAPAEKASARSASAMPLPVDNAAASGPQTNVTDGVPVQTGSAVSSSGGGTGPAAAAPSDTGGGGDAAPSSSSSGPSGGSASGRAGSGENTADIAARFAARVEANKQYPYSAIRLGQTGSVTVWVDLSADGSLEGCGISASSGVSSLDKSALQAVRASCPFPHGAGRSIHIVETIYFNLNE